MRLKKLIDSPILLTLQILISFGLTVVMFPFSLLVSPTLNGLYNGPNAIIINQPVLVLLYNIALLMATLVYWQVYSHQNRVVFPRLYVSSYFFLVLILGIFAYPPVYDPIFYFLGSYTWLRGNVNPYYNLQSFLHNFGQPTTVIPILHNYLYGPIWLTITSLIFTLCLGNFFGFMLILKIIAGGSILATVIIIRKITGHSLPKLIWLVGLNPIIVFFLYAGGHMESLQAMLLTLSFYLILQSKYLYSTVALSLLLLIKITLLPAVLPIFAWTIRRIITESKFRFSQSLQRIMWETFIPFGLIFLSFIFIFHLNAEYLNQLGTAASNEIRSYSSMPGLITIFLQTILPHFFYRSIFDIIFGFFRLLMIGYGLYLVLQVLLRKNLQLQYVAQASWFLYTCTLFTSGINVKPWYLIPSIALSFLSTEIERYTMVISTILFMIAIVYLNTVPYFDGVVQSIIEVNAILLAYVVPFSLIILSTRPGLLVKLQQLNLLDWVTKKLTLSPDKI
jgi:hypothetical protein